MNWQGLCLWIMHICYNFPCQTKVWNNLQPVRIDWGKLLQAMGRILKQLKCYWYLLGFTLKMEKQRC